MIELKIKTPTGEKVYSADDISFGALEECIKLVKEFEDNGYKVSIEDSGNGYYADFIMRFSWNDRLIEFNGRSFGHNKLLYTTDDGLITD